LKRNIHKPEHCKRILEVEVSPQEILPIVEDVYSDIQKMAQVPGFRKGRAPRETVKRLYRDEAGREVLRRSIPEFCQKAIEAENISPLELPEIYDINWEWEKPLVFKARFEVRPDFRLKPYKGLKLKKKKIEVKDEEVDKVLKDLQDKHAELVTIQGRSVQKGDFILCDYKSSAGEKILENKENVLLSLDENVNFKDFAQQLWGANVGQIKKVQVELPQDFSNKDLQGKKVDIEVKIKEIKEKRLPLLDDEFAKTAGQFNNLDELKQGIRKDLLSLKEVQSKKELASQLLELLLEANKFNLPASMVDRSVKDLEVRFTSGLKQRGARKEEIEKSSDVIKKRAGEEAEKQVKTYFILGKIAQNENIEITDAQIDKHIENLARQWGQDFEKIKKNFQDRHLVEEVRLELREEKAMEFLLQNAQIEEEVK
jgi:trigger factor